MVLKEGARDMTVDTRIERGRMNVSVKGRLDTTTSSELEMTLNEGLRGIQELIFDFAALEYISSAGLRVLLSAHKTVKKQGGKTIVRRANEEVREVLFITGFSDIMEVE